MILTFLITALLHMPHGVFTENYDIQPMFGAMQIQQTTDAEVTAAFGISQPTIRYGQIQSSLTAYDIQ